MNKYYIDNNTAVDLDTQIELADNGLTGDAKIVLCKAREISPESMAIHPQNESWMYYLQTNGNPVMLDEDNGEEFVEASGLNVDDVREAIIGSLDDSDCGEWPLAYLPKASDDE